MDNKHRYLRDRIEYASSRKNEAEDIHCFFGVFLFLLPDIIYASNCFVRAGRFYKIDPDLLMAVAWKESHFDKQAIGRNPRKGYGVGLMQIDSQHFAALKRYGITPRRLLTDGCLNIFTGAHYLAISFRKFGRTWQAVGSYNAGFKIDSIQNQRRKRYAEAIKVIYFDIKRGKHPSLSGINK